MYSVLIVLMVIASVLMCLIVLIQESKGGGLASGFASSNQIMGVRKTTDVIEKTTWSLAIAMVLISIALAYLTPQASAVQSVMDTTTMPVAPQQTQQSNLPVNQSSSQQTPAAQN